MNRIFSLGKMKEIFREDSKFKVFLLSVLITGLSYGLYKGMLDNFLAEVVGIETLFIVSAVLGLCNSAYAATIKTKKASA